MADSIKYKIRDPTGFAQTMDDWFSGTGVGGQGCTLTYLAREPIDTVEYFDGTLKEWVKIDTGYTVTLDPSGVSVITFPAGTVVDTLNTNNIHITYHLASMNVNLGAGSLNINLLTRYEDRIIYSDLDMVDSYPRTGTVGNWNNTLKTVFDQSRESTLTCSANDTMQVLFNDPQYLESIHVFGTAAGVCPPAVDENELVMPRIDVYYSNGDIEIHPNVRGVFIRHDTMVMRVDIFCTASVNYTSVVMRKKATFRERKLPTKDDERVTFEDLDIEACAPRDGTLGSWSGTIQSTLDGDRHHRITNTIQADLRYFFIEPMWIHSIQVLGLPALVCPPSTTEQEVLMDSATIYYKDGTSSGAIVNRYEIIPENKGISAIYLTIGANTQVIETVMLKRKPALGEVDALSQKSVRDRYPDEIVYADLDKDASYPRHGTLGNWSNAIDRTLDKDRNSTITNAGGADYLTYYFLHPEWLDSVHVMATGPGSCPPASTEQATLTTRIDIYYIDGRVESHPFVRHAEPCKDIGVVKVDIFLPASLVITEVIIKRMVRVDPTHGERVAIKADERINVNDLDIEACLPSNINLTTWSGTIESTLDGDRHHRIITTGTGTLQYMFLTPQFISEIQVVGLGAGVCPPAGLEAEVNMLTCDIYYKDGTCDLLTNRLRAHPKPFGIVAIYITVATGTNVVETLLLKGIWNPSIPKTGTTTITLTAESTHQFAITGVDCWGDTAGSVFTLAIGGVTVWTSGTGANGQCGRSFNPPLVHGDAVNEAVVLTPGSGTNYRMNFTYNYVTGYTK